MRTFEIKEILIKSQTTSGAIEWNRFYSHVEGCTPMFHTTSMRCQFWCLLLHRNGKWCISIAVADVASISSRFPFFVNFLKCSCLLSHSKGFHSIRLNRLDIWLPSFWNTSSVALNSLQFPVLQPLESERVGLQFQKLKTLGACYIQSKGELKWKSVNQRNW